MGHEAVYYVLLDNVGPSFLSKPEAGIGDLLVCSQPVDNEKEMVGYSAVSFL